MRICAASGPSGGVGYFVVFDLQSLRIAQEAGVNKTEVRDVEEVFDDAGTEGAEDVGSGRNGAEAGSVRERPLRRRMRGFAETDEDGAGGFLDSEDVGAGFGGRRQVWLSGDADALARGGVLPCVVGTDEVVAGNRAERKFGSAMDAEVEPAVQALR